MASGHCLVIDVLLSLTVDGHRIEERRALEESRLEADARDSALALETAHRHFLRGQSPAVSRESNGFPTGFQPNLSGFQWISSSLREIQVAGDAIFLDARSVDEFDRSHISGAWSFSERSPLWARLASEREDLERTSNPALKQLVQFPNRLGIARIQHVVNSMKHRDLSSNQVCLCSDLCCYFNMLS